MAKKLTSDFSKRARTNDDLRYELAKLNNCKISTIDRWFKVDDKNLLNIENLECIAKAMGVLEIQELLEEQEITA